MTVLDRLWGKISPEPNTGCWLWTGCIGTGGYGRFGKQSAHRASYKLHKGPIPEGLDLDHLCRVRCCVNPDHLEPVTRKVNCQRGETGHHQREKAKLITHCPKGHEYTPENTKMAGTIRQCRTCANMYLARWRERNPNYNAEYGRKYRAMQKLAGGAL